MGEAFLLIDILFTSDEKKLAKNQKQGPTQNFFTCQIGREKRNPAPKHLQPREKLKFTSKIII